MLTICCVISKEGPSASPYCIGLLDGREIWEGRVDHTPSPQNLDCATIAGNHTPHSLGVLGVQLHPLEREIVQSQHYVYRRKRVYTGVLCLQDNRVSYVLQDTGCPMSYRTTVY